MKGINGISEFADFSVENGGKLAAEGHALLFDYVQNLNHELCKTTWTQTTHAVGINCNNLDLNSWNVPLVENIEQREYINALERVIGILPTKPPSKWDDKAWRLAYGYWKTIINRGKDFNLTAQILLRLLRDGIVKIVPYTGWGRDDSYTIELQLSLDSIKGWGAEEQKAAEKKAPSGAAPAGGEASAPEPPMV